MNLKDVLESIISEDKTLYSNEWLSIKQTDDWYVYMHQEKSDGKGVAVLGYRQIGEDVEFLGRFEQVPCHKDGAVLCSLTGMVERGDNPLETAVKELVEESGIEKSSEYFEELGTLRSSKASDTTFFLFAVDLSDTEDKEVYEGDGDGTKGEEGSYCKWVSRQDVIQCKDPLLMALVMRAGI